MSGLRRALGCAIIALAGASVTGRQAPSTPDAVRFAVIGDMGTGKKPQYDLGQTMETWRGTFPFEFAIMLGDNIYGGSTPADLRKKFELPYKALLDGGVTFHASLGNHDSPSQRTYKPFNMGGESYYTFRKGNAQFFALDTNYMSPAQLAWLAKELRESKADWKIPFFHHPLYSSALFHGSSVELRLVLEPLFAAHGVQVAFAGHEHVYERIKPQKGIVHFIEGASGQLRKGDLRLKSTLTAAGYDKGLSFILVEIAGDVLRFRAVSQAGVVVDAGAIARNPAVMGMSTP